MIKQTNENLIDVDHSMHVGIHGTINDYTDITNDEKLGFKTGLYAFHPFLDKKILLEPLHQVHSYNDIRRLEPGLPELTYEEKSNFPPVTHPIVRVHPDRNFRKSLYFTSNTSLEIGGMSLEQGKELHKWLVNYISQPKFCYTHKWQKNDLIMWDNRVLLHRVIPYDYAKYRRAMIRGTVEGEVPVLGPFSNEVRLNNN